MHKIYVTNSEYILQKKLIYRSYHHRIPSLVLLMFKIKTISCLIIYFNIQVEYKQLKDQ